MHIPMLLYCSNDFACIVNIELNWKPPLFSKFFNVNNVKENRLVKQRCQRGSIGWRLWRQPIDCPITAHSLSQPASRVCWRLWQRNQRYNSKKRSNLEQIWNPMISTETFHISVEVETLHINKMLMLMIHPSQTMQDE